MHVDNNKKKTCTVCVQITQLITIRNIAHQMLNTMKGQINMRSIMHCQKNTSLDLQHQTLTSQNSPIVISIQIRGCWITNLMILNNIQNRLIPQTSTQFFFRTSHWFIWQRTECCLALRFEAQSARQARSARQNFRARHCLRHNEVQDKTECCQAL